MIKINKNTVVYIVCPAYAKTGGPELLHQLASSLLAMKVNAVMIYVNTKEDDKNYSPEDFKIYNVKYGLENDIVDNKDNVLILPEIYVDKINKYKEIRTAIWWLSVDNYTKNYTFKKSLEIYGLKHTIKLLLNGTLIRGKYYKNAVYHLCQSYYSIDFLKENGINNAMYLSDYINDSYLTNNSFNNKEDIVLYNPKKGIEFTKKIIDKAKNIKFVPIQNLTTEEVKDLLLKSKVYIDFGNHPGKDRFPREAAMCGCCVITGKRGAAKYFKDVPIDGEFKFEDKEENIDLIINQIKKCLDEYDKEVIKFTNYRKIISGEKKKFQNDIIEVFGLDKGIKR